MSETIHEEHTVHHAELHGGSPKPSSLANILGIIGFIILIVIIVWGLIHLANLSDGWFSSLFKSSAPSIQITAPAEATSGTPVTISWKYSTDEKGTYAFLYQCAKGFSYKAQTATGSDITIPCGAAYTVAGTAGPTNISVTPSLTATSLIQVPFSILFMPSATGTRAQGSATMTINTGVATPAPVVEPTTPAKPTPTPKPDNGLPHTTGPADLSVRILAIGIIDPATGAFVNRAPLSGNDMVAVQFDIANVGGTSTGGWYFTAQLPTIPGYTYNSPAQISLAPGDHIVNTLRFTQASAGIIQIIVDPMNSIPETNEMNNLTSQSLNVYYSY